VLSALPEFSTLWTCWKWNGWMRAWEMASAYIALLIGRCQCRVYKIISQLTFTFAICCRPSVRPSVCLSVCRQRSCILLRRLKFSAIFLRRLVPWLSVDIHRKFYEDRLRETPPPRELNTRGMVKYSDELSTGTKFGDLEWPWTA